MIRVTFFPSFTSGWDGSVVSGVSLVSTRLVRLTLCGSVRENSAQRSAASLSMGYRLRICAIRGAGVHHRGKFSIATADKLIVCFQRRELLRSLGPRRCKTYLTECAPVQDENVRGV